MIKAVKTIFIVDDNNTNLTAAKNALDGNYKAYALQSAARMFKLIEKITPDLILLDLVMPEMDGFEAMKLLKSDERLKSIPVIFLTAKSDASSEIQGFELGALDYIKKPFSPQILIKRIESRIETDMLIKAGQKMEELVLIDPLTKIDNRRSFDLRSGLEWARALREQTLLSVAVIDIDNFKNYNDYYGHLEGDEVIKSVANKISESLNRKTDFVARFGGEEFVVILPLTSPENGKMVLQMVRMGIENLMISHERSPVSSVVTVSIGGASTIPKMDDSFRDLFYSADKMLYRAKECKNKVMWDPEEYK
jgi:diguanylate cyclase (GGDEF)-like protein